MGKPKMKNKDKMNGVIGKQQTLMNVAVYSFMT